MTENKEKHLGFKCFVSQVETASNFNFNIITLRAIGNVTTPELVGYIVWGKYGFVMRDIQDQTTFGIQMFDLGLEKIATVNKLVSNKTGSYLWRYIGFSWRGEFALQEKSQSMKLYNEYKRRRLRLY